MATEVKNRLQFIHVDGVFATAQEAKDYVYKMSQQELWGSLYAEPMVLKYGDPTDVDKQYLLFVIGANGDGYQDNTQEVNAERYHYIDSHQYEYDINELLKHSGLTDSQIAYISGVTSNIIAAGGLDPDGKYIKSTNQIISTATSLADADDKLAEAIQAVESKNTLSGIDTASIDTTVDVQDSGTTVKADLKIANHLDFGGQSIPNDLGVKNTGLDDGLYFAINADYDVSTSKLVITKYNADGTKEDIELQLPKESVLTNAVYVKKNRNLVLTVTNEDGTTKDITVPMGGVIESLTTLDATQNANPWSSSPIILEIVPQSGLSDTEKAKYDSYTGEHVHEWQNVMRATVKVLPTTDTTHPNNILTTVSNETSTDSGQWLYVDGRATNISYDANTNVKQKIDSVANDVVSVSSITTSELAKRVERVEVPHILTELNALVKTSDNITLSVDQYNTSTSGTVKPSVVFEGANTTEAGLMTAAMYKAVIDLSNRGGSYVGVSFPNNSSLPSFSWHKDQHDQHIDYYWSFSYAGKTYSGELGDYTFIEHDTLSASGGTSQWSVVGYDGNGQVTKVLEDVVSLGWVFNYSIENQINIAGTGELGVVMGSEVPGEIFVDVDGSMRLYDYTTVIGNIETNRQNILANDDKIADNTDLIGQNSDKIDYLSGQIDSRQIVLENNATDAIQLSWASQGSTGKTLDARAKLAASQAVSGDNLIQIVSDAQNPANSGLFVGNQAKFLNVSIDGVSKNVEDAISGNVKAIANVNTTLSTVSGALHSEITASSAYNYSQLQTVSGQVKDIAHQELQTQSGVLNTKIDTVTVTADATYPNAIQVSATAPATGGIKVSADLMVTTGSDSLLELKQVGTTTNKTLFASNDSNSINYTGGNVSMTVQNAIANSQFKVAANLTPVTLIKLEKDGTPVTDATDLTDGPFQIYADIKIDATPGSKNLLVVDSNAELYVSPFASDHIYQDGITVQQAITNLSTKISGEITDLAAEVAARIAGDTALGGRIDTEISNRSAADDLLRASIGTNATNISNEISNRIAADTTLSNSITAETKARTDADTALGDRITNEVTDRATADSLLQTAIDTEISNRSAADSAFNDRLTTLDGAALKRTMFTTIVKDFSYYPEASYVRTDIHSYTGPDFTTIGNTSVSIPAATTDIAGVMTSTLYNQVQSAFTDIRNLQTKSGIFVGKTYDTYADMEADTATLDAHSIGDYTYVQKDETHSGTTSMYVIAGEPTVKRWAYLTAFELLLNIANDITPGLVMSSPDSSTTGGQIRVDTTGIMYVNGWSAQLQALQNEIDRAKAEEERLLNLIYELSGSTIFGGNWNNP
jgi:hypothetical protein